MAGPGNSSRNSNYSGRSGGQSREGAQPQRRAAPPAPPADLPEDFAAAAEEVIKELVDSNRSKQASNSKIRRLFSLVITIFNRERLRSEEKITAESRQSLMMARVRMAYEAGRDDAVKDFIKKAKLMEYIRGVGWDREKFIRFAHYMEALVAWRRYYGDKD